MTKSTCSVEDCDDSAKGKGFCRRHYFSFWYYGDPLRAKPRPTVSHPKGTGFATRFWAKVEKGPYCWEWQGSLNKGYGNVTRTVDGQRRWLQSHRVAYELHHNTTIPDGMTIDHLCRNTRCVNPNHLEVVTQRENNMRNMSKHTRNAKKTHCERGGHPLSGENLRIKPGKYGPNRECKTCAKELRAARRARRAS